MSIIDPQPCPPDDGGGGSDVESLLLCDIDADGNLLGTALAVYEYDQDGNPVGPPTFVDPTTGDPYVPQGTLQPCGEPDCAAPVQFCFTTTSTGPVDHPGRIYDIELPINPGFAVQSLFVDAVQSAANIVWDVSDPDGEQFRQDLTAFMEPRLPAAAVVTITNPNAGQVICGTAQPMQIHIECLRLDEDPPDLVELIFNAGEDLILNPAYNEDPPLDPPVSQGNYGFHLLAREDDPGPFPINQPAERANCTNVANRGWETNDVGRTFEIWGQDQVTGQNVTPTPRGTPVQEMTSDGPPPGGRSTIWQTFQAPSSAPFIIRVVHGARDAGEEHRIQLRAGDTDDTQGPGALIDDITTPGVVTSSPGGPGPWTTFTQTIPLNAGQTYTLSLSSTNPVAGNRGGLFTDMRAYIDRPDTRATAVTDDDTCVVTVDETTTISDPQFWAPQCSGGVITGWRNVETGEFLSNTAFWAQVPSPEPGACPPPAGEDGEGSVAANLVQTYPVCAIVGGVATTLQRVVITDASGGALLEQFIGPDGAPVPTPATYSIGSCTDVAFLTDQVLCDDNGPFLRKYVQNINPTTNEGQVQQTTDFTLDGALYTTVGAVTDCGGFDTEITGPFCDLDQALTVFRVSTFDRAGTEIAFHYIDNNGVPAPVSPNLVDGPCCASIGLGTYCYDQGGGVIGRMALVRQCDDNQNPPTPVVFAYDVETGDLLLPIPAIINCDPGPVADTETLVLCDEGNGNAPFLRHITYNEAGLPLIVGDTELDGVTPYVAVGDAILCQAADVGVDAEVLVLCDEGTPDVNGEPTQFVRRIVFDNQTGLPTGVVDTDLQTGLPYVAVGPIATCGPRTDPNDFAQTLWCIAGAPGIRQAVRDEDTGAVTVTWIRADGTVFVPTPAELAAATPGSCAAPTPENDTELEVLCDFGSTDAGNEPLRFIRRYVYDNTGAIVSTTDTELDGTTAYAPVGPIYNCGEHKDDVRFSQTVWCIGGAPGIRETYANVDEFGPPPTVVWRRVDNNDFIPTPAELAAATPGACAGAGVDATVNTGIRRTVGVAAQNIKAAFPGLQSVSLMVIAGVVNVTMTDGAAVAVPAGASLTWSTNDDDDSSLTTASFAGTTAATDYILNWTYKTGVGG